jgi:hypothetical protein
MENQDRSNEEWKIKNPFFIAPRLIFHSSLLLSWFSILHCSSLDFPFVIAPILIFHSSLLLSWFSIRQSREEQWRIENQDRSNDEWKIKREAMKNGKSR